MHFWTSPFGTGLMGALVGGALSLAGTVLGFRLQSRREDHRHSEEQRRAVIILAADWWRAEKPTFEAAVEELRAAADGWDAGRDPTGELAALVGDRVAALLRSIPADLDSRLYWYGSEGAYRRLLEGRTELLDLRAVTTRELAAASLDAYDRRRGVDGSAIEQEGSRRRAVLGLAYSAVTTAVDHFDGLARALEEDSRQERERIRGSARLQPAAGPS